MLTKRISAPLVDYDSQDSKFEKSVREITKDFEKQYERYKDIA